MHRRYPATAYWAQSIDNVSPDSFEWEGKALADDDPRREDVQAAVYDVSQSGDEVVRDGHSRAILHDDRFVIQSVGEDRDTEGRLAPLVIVGILPPSGQEDWTAGVAGGADRFLRSLGRSASADRLAHIQRWLTALFDEKKKRRRKRRLVLAIGLGVVLLILGYAAYRSSIDSSPEAPANRQLAPPASGD